MCHNSLSEPCPHLVRWLMGISIIGFPITTLLTSLLRILPLLTPHAQNTTRPKQICLEQMSNTIRLRSKHPQTWLTYKVRFFFFFSFFLDSQGGRCCCLTHVFQNRSSVFMVTGCGGTFIVAFREVGNTIKIMQIQYTLRDMNSESD